MLQLWEIACGNWDLEVNICPIVVLKILGVFELKSFWKEYLSKMTLISWFLIWELTSVLPYLGKTSPDLIQNIGRNLLKVTLYI